MRKKANMMNPDRIIGAIAVLHLSACGSIHKDRVWEKISVQEVRNCHAPAPVFRAIAHAHYHLEPGSPICGLGLGAKTRLGP